MELQDCGEDDRLEKELEFYLTEAKLAKQFLDCLVEKAAQGSADCEVQYADVKSMESTERKARDFCGGSVRKVTDMARVTVVCGTTKDLAQVYSEIKGSLQVSGKQRY